MKKSIIFAAAWIIAAMAPVESHELIHNAIAIDSTDTHDDIIEKASRIVPTDRQLQALQNEFIAFLHFGPNTFTRMEWGTGKEEPSIFDLQQLDTDQWVKSLDAAGIKMVILTAKHHDGFVLWQSRYTRHGIMSSPFRNGQGDIMRSLSESCRHYGMKLGVYLSPADLYQIESPHGLYGNGSKRTPRRIPRKVEGRPFADTTEFEFVVDDYNEYFLSQLFELLTEYGPIHEVWFDGANPKEKGGQTYDYEAWKTVIRRLAPEAVIFEGGDVRWCGNESGATRTAEYNVRPIPFPEEYDESKPFAVRGIADRNALFNAKELCYRQAETNTSIREGWFYRDEDRQRVRSADDVFDIYERAVGGNSTFLLNVPPNRCGRLSDEDVKVLAEVGRRVNATYGSSLPLGDDTPDELTDGDIATAIDLSSPLTIALGSRSGFNRIVLQEPIATRGERIEEIEVSAFYNGQWHRIAQASNVGYKRIMRFPEVTGADSLRIRVAAARGLPWLATLSVHRYDNHPPRLCASRDSSGRLVISPKADEFAWKPSGINPAAMLSEGFTIRYTLDGSEPNLDSPLYEHPVEAPACELRAIAFLDGKAGAELREQLMMTGITVISDEPLTFDMGEERLLNGFAYSPRKDAATTRLVASGTVEISADGTNWTVAAHILHGNIVNDPSRRIHYLDTPLSARFVRVNDLHGAGPDGNEAVMAPDEFGVF